MDFNLSFTIEFYIDSNAKQDYFIFNGNEAIAHLYRVNDTIKLYLKSNESYEMYEISNPDKLFKFTWNGFKVNGKNMKMMKKSETELEQLNFDSYTFLSPYFDFMSDIITERIEPTYSIAGVNYGFMILIVLSIGMCLKTDRFAEKLFHRLLQRDTTKDIDDVYATVVL